MWGIGSRCARLLAPLEDHWPLRQLRARPSARRIVLVSIVKDEFDALLEWVAWHRSRGFTRFEIGDHDSRDGTTELLEALELCGVLRRHRVPSDPAEPPQIPFYNRIVRAYGGANPILGFIDADEFVMGDGRDNLAADVARLFRGDNVAALGLNWRIYGSSGNVRPSAGPLVLRFNGHASQDFSGNRFIKSFALRSRIRYMDVHQAMLRSGRYVDARGQDLEPEGQGARHRTVGVQWHRLFVAHYVTKSVQEHERKKARRGSAAQGAQGVKGQAYFARHDRNERFTAVRRRLLRRALREERRLLENLRDHTLYFRPCFGAAELDPDRNTLSGWLAWSGPSPDKVSVTVRCGDEEWRTRVVPSPDSHQPCAGSAPLRKFTFSLAIGPLAGRAPADFELRPTGSSTRLPIRRMTRGGTSPRRV